MLATETKATTAPIQPARHDAVWSWNQVVGDLDPFLWAVNRRLTDQVHSFEPEVTGYAEYALTGQGKQLRPVLVALSGGAIDQIDESHERVAVIIEMVHLATLVHDDVVDEAQIRRGRPTLASNWGNEIAVLFGDCLFAQALKLAAGFPTTEICRAVSAATNTVCAGEILQTQARYNFSLSREDYFKVLRMKTGELFALSCDLGAYLSGASPAQRRALCQYGLALGTAYQVFDDCLDVFGCEERAGKSLGTDLAKGKLTLPILLLLEQAEPDQRKQILAWLDNWQPQFYQNLRHLLHNHAVLAESQKVFRDYLDLANSLLEPLPVSEPRKSLQRLAEYLACQMNTLGNHGQPSAHE